MIASTRILMEAIARRGRAHARAIAKPATIVVDGIQIRVDYEHWSPTMVWQFFTEKYEADERDVLGRVLSPDDVVLEIGGGVGLIGLVCCKTVPERNVHIFEANPSLVQAALANFELNNYFPNIHNKAVVGESYRGDKAAFHLHDDFWSSSLVESSSRRKTIEVEAVKLSRLLNLIKPTVLIVDVEGGEFDILTDCSLSNVNKICIELHTRYIGSSKVTQVIKKIIDSGLSLEFEKSRGERLLFQR